MKKLRFVETSDITHPTHTVTNQKALILSKTAGRLSYITRINQVIYCTVGRFQNIDEGRLQLYVHKMPYCMDTGRSGIETRRGRDFSTVQTSPVAHPVSCKMGTGPFPGVKCGRGVLLTTHPVLVPRSWKSRAIPLPTLWTKPGL